MIVLIFGLMLLFGCSSALELLELRVPGHVPLGTRAAVACRWALGPADVLYSIKWYKDGKEFFRHVPRDVEPRRKFPLPGVDVEEYDTSGSRIILAPALLETGGRYRCEVSGEGPLFPTVSDHADMTVVVFPIQGPVLSGLKSKYRPLESLRVTCTSGRSHPATQLAWYLNGEPAPGTLTQYIENELVTSSLVMDLIVDTTHFEGKLLKIKCLATITPIYWRSSEKSTMLDSASIPHEHGKRNTYTTADKVQTKSAGSVKYSLLINLVVLCGIMY